MEHYSISDFGFRWSSILYRMLLRKFIFFDYEDEDDDEDDFGKTELQYTKLDICHLSSDTFFLFRS